MNKLLLIAVLGFAILSLTDAEEESKSEIADEAGTDLDAVANDEIDENLTDPETRRRRRQRKGKKKKKAKRKSKKKNKKKSKRKSKKNNKKRNKKRKNGRKRIGGKNARQECSASCVTNLWKYRDVMVKYGNYEKQFKRITKFKTLGEKKLAKKGDFSKGAIQLKEAGGGDADALACNGDTASSAAKQVQNLTTFIENCTIYINDVCNSSMPPPPPDNETKPCLDAIDAFKKVMNDCAQVKSDAGKLCSCLGDASLVNNSAIILECDLSSNYLKKFVAYKSSCIAAFGSCRKYEDDVGSAVSICSKDPAKELQKLAIVSANLDIANSIADFVLKLLDTRRLKKRSARADMSCTDFDPHFANYTKLYNSFPGRQDLGDLVATILNATVTPACTDAEKKSLMETSDALADTIAAVKELVATQQMSLLQITGSTPSTADLAAASSAAAAAAATTAAAASRNRQAHAALLKKLRVMKS